MHRNFPSAPDQQGLRYLGSYCPSIQCEVGGCKVCEVGGCKVSEGDYNVTMRDGVEE